MMKKAYEEDPKQPKNSRGELLPIEVLCVDGHHNFCLYWYHKGKFYDENPLYAVDRLESQYIILWDYLPDISQYLE